MHKRLLESQKKAWNLIAKNYRELEEIRSKDVFIDNVRFRIQCNPNRIQSTIANISTAAIEKRPCFLCEKNRPAEQQGLAFEAFTILVNPFPIFPEHYTIANGHEPQTIQGHFGTLLRLSKQMDDCVVFYNGPKCGASAPDHLHFQAGSKGILPVETDFDKWRTEKTTLVYAENDVQLSQLKDFFRSGWLLEGQNENDATLVFDRLVSLLPVSELDNEPMMNVLAWYTQKAWKVLLLPRKAHRPSCYHAQEPNKVLVSPASVEMGGLVVAARTEDFERLDSRLLKQIFDEVSMDNVGVTAISNQLVKTFKEPLLEVGIVSDFVIPFSFSSPYRIVQSNIDNTIYHGHYSVKVEHNRIVFENIEYETLEFEPIETLGAAFTLPNVKIGIGFHWERTEEQAFEGNLKFILACEKITAVNRIPLESYLTSVISSEMSAKASSELLKAHAVISRSWLLSQIQQKDKNKGGSPAFIETESERIRWYDREDHTLYDVCADDHCQRYQGITKASTPQVREAILATRGVVLRFQSMLCDARFSKCCGGVMETFESCWENSPKAYLKSLLDFESAKPVQPIDLSREVDANKWINGSPEAFCNTKDKKILEQVLNNYDQETTDFYRWSVSYTTQEISTLAAKRSGIDFGRILDLIPLERGPSSRLIKLLVVGSKRSVTLGKELEIRRTFSESHLYSSAFTIEKTSEGFIFHGAGWGHGVGLCQIGAAVMGERGYSYQSILEHYYPETNLSNLYR